MRPLERNHKLHTEGNKGYVGVLNPDHSRYTVFGLNLDGHPFLDKIAVQRGNLSHV